MERLRPNDLRDARDVSSYAGECDVLVVGLGIAGACAMMEAVDAGADVIVLERAGGGGGTSANSGGLIYLGGGTPVQEASGFSDTPDEMFRFLVAASGPGADEEKIRPYCDESVALFHWLEEQGLPFKRSFYEEPGMESMTDDCLVFSGGENCTPYASLAVPAPRGHKPQTEGKAGPFLMQKILEATARREARAFTDTLCETLIVESDGRVVGVVARTAGEERCFRARRGVVLAAGGFSTNSEMVARHVPELTPCKPKNATEGDDGRAIRMAQAAHAGTLRMDQAEVALPVTIPNRLGRGLFVNAHAQRFINEDTYYGHIGIEALFGQGGQTWLLVDEPVYEVNMVGMQPTCVGETIAELEAEAGFPTGALQATVDYYNRYAKHGEDPAFGKRPEMVQPIETAPFALLQATPDTCFYACMTLGGLATSPHGAVLDTEGEPIPGLYAAGRTAALFSGRGYAGSGLSLGDGAFFGRRAGAAAASASPV